VYILPTSFVQRRLWFLDQFESGSAVYNTPVAYRLSGTLDLAALERSLNEIVQRHEVLRTTFASEDETVLQQVASWLQIPLPVVDLEGSANLEDALPQLVNDEARQPFDLARGPLFRARVFRIAMDDHVLVVTSHHIVFDGWSEGVLFHELHVLYDAFRQGRPSPLPELPIQYADYAVWQRDRLTGEDLDRQLSFWKRQLAGLGVLDLPVGRQRPKMQTYRGTLRAVSVPPNVVAAVKTVGLQEKATLFMTLAAAFHTLLHRYSGQHDLALGFVVSGRDRSELEGLLGCFVNTLVLRADSSGDPAFRQFVARVREAALGAYAHQDLPFERLVEEVPERDLSRSPLFQVLFNQGSAPKETALGDLAVRRMPVDTGVSKFDMAVTLTADERTGGLNGWLEYNTDLFDAATIDRFVGHYLTLLEGIAANPDARLSALPLLTEAERVAQVAWNSTRVEYSEACVHGLISAQAQRTPGRVAVESEGRSLTYGELETRSEHLARVLRVRGVVPGIRVGVFMERCPEMVVALLGIMKAGGAYVPLDPAFPRERLSYMVQDSGAALLLAHRATVEELPSSAVPVVRVDAQEPNPEAALNVVRACPDDLAYVIYTSGSTGRPKGVAITHRSLVNLLESMGRTPGLDESDVLLSVTTLSFDIAALELYLPLLKGARLAIASRDEVWDGRRLLQRMSSSQATVMQATPATWRLLMEAGWEGTAGFKALCGGEALTRDLAHDLLQRAGEVWNMYGPTETTVWSSTWRVAPDDDVISIGRPIGNTQMWVLDAHLERMPVGVPGELYIGGVGVAQGYWERTELTEARFVPDLFSGLLGSRLYRTGDMARWLRDGRLECLGRLDHQVKLRGFRIELGEIEAGLTRHTVVRDVVVIVREDAPGDKQLVAYIVAQDPPADLIDQLRALVRTTMPEYMVPAAFVLLERLPLTPNGKVDRKALPQPGSRDTELPAGAVAPRTTSETLVLGIFSDVLGRSDLGVLDSFFDLGGHSLMAARLMSRLQAVSGLDIPLRSLFERPTVAGLAEVLDGLAWVARSKSLRVDAGSREEIEL
jgi:amino acid adenylation domain-containing protein